MKQIFFLIVFTLQVSLSCFSQDTLLRYTDAEIIKLANHVKNLEKRTAAYSATQYYGSQNVENNALQPIAGSSANPCRTGFSSPAPGPAAKANRTWFRPAIQ